MSHVVTNVVLLLRAPFSLPCIRGARNCVGVSHVCVGSQTHRRGRVQHSSCRPLGKRQRTRHSATLDPKHLKSGLLFSRLITALSGTTDFQTIGIKLSLKITNRTVEKICPKFMFSHFKFCLVLQGMISSNFPGERICIEVRCFLERVDVLKNNLLCRKVLLDSTSSLCENSSTVFPYSPSLRVSLNSLECEELDTEFSLEE